MSKRDDHIFGLFPVLLLLLSGLAISYGTANAVGIGAPFPIATTGTGEFAISAAYDGTNYLVGIQGDAANITAQRVSRSGTLAGPRISTGRHGGAPSVAFDGANYLMVWCDEGLLPNPLSNPRYLYGAFISQTGSVIGSPFLIDPGPLTRSGTSGIAFGGGKYLVAYYQTDAIAGKDKVYGRFISPSGAVGNEITISFGYGNQGFNSVAFDGANFFVVWNNHANNREVKGRFVSQGGISATEVTVKAGGNPNDNPVSVAFDGSNYLVLWTEQVSGSNWDVFGQLVTPGGVLVNGAIAISRAPGQQIAPSAVFDGKDYLVVWTDMRNDTNGNGACEAGEGTCGDIYGQILSKSGTLLGSEFIINKGAGNQQIGVPIGPPVNGNVLVLFNTECNVFQDSWGDVYGLFLSYSEERGNVSPAIYILLF